MKIGILLCGHPAGDIRKIYGDYFTMFTRLLDGQGLDFARYDLEAMEFPASVHDCDGWLISGSKHATYEPHAFIPPLEDFIRRAHAARVPMVGICFGHQIIAQALGGRAGKFPGGWSVGRVEYATEDGGTLALNAWHQDQVLEPPEGARTTAWSESCAHAVLEYPGGIWSVQPHPEFDNDTFELFLKVRGRPAGVPEPILRAALAAEKRPIDIKPIARRIADHFRRHAKVPHG